MIVVIAGTNRPRSNTLKVARLVDKTLVECGEGVSLIDLSRLPAELFAPSSYATTPDSFQPFQEAVLAATGIVTVVPEYNGSYPGVLKFFIDMLPFPESLFGKPAAFVGLSSGRWGGLRAVEQLSMVFQYRQAHLYGRRVFLPHIKTFFDGEDRPTDRDALDRLESVLQGFADFSHRLSGQ